MSVYMVERELPGISMGELADAQKAAIDTSKQFTKLGKPVEYIRRRASRFGCSPVYIVIGAALLISAIKTHLPFTRCHRFM